MDAALSEDEAVFGINIVLGALKVLAHVSSSLDEIVKFLWKSWSKTVSFKDAENLNTSDRANHANASLVTKKGANLGWADTLLSVVADHLNALLSSEVEPVWSGAAVWASGRADAFARRMETTHRKG